MSVRTRQMEAFNQGAQPSQTQSFVTIGMVVDTNDPQQMGRVRAICPQWGDSWHTSVEDLPWALYMSPFGGQMQVGTRGPGVQTSDGGVSYGMWAIPKVGSQVIMVCIDGNPMTRMYIGCLYDQFTPHTMPHGRFMYEDHPELEKSGSDPKPYGPYTSAETFIQPLAQNLRRAFGNVGEPNFEFRSRGADYSVSRVDVSQLGQTYSKVEDDKDVKHGNWTSTQGYQINRADPNGNTTLTDRNYDSMVYSFTSPGFHGFSMDDRQDNCRIRLRTTSGHQIIMDDTNERIYIATAQGSNWIEMDQDGNIDIFTSNKLNVHAAKDINFTSDESIRMFAKKGIHMHAEEEVRIKAAQDVHVKTDANLRLQADAAGYLETGSTLDIKSGSTLNLQTGGQISLMAGDLIAGDAGIVRWNGGLASSASPASTQLALWTNRVPAHEPWARTMTKTDTSHEPEFPYSSDQVGRSERGRTIDRGAFWRR